MTNWKKYQDDGGTIQVIASLMIGTLLIGSAVGLTFADGHSIRSQAQEALDAAVLAGASAPATATNAEIVALAQAVYASNRNKRAAETAKIDVLSRASATFKVSSTTVMGELSFELRSPFLSFLGRESMAIAVNSGARRAMGVPICVLGLDRSEAATIDLVGRADVQLDNCAAMANSSSGAGIHQVGGAAMRALDIGVNGGYHGQNFSPKPTPGVEPVPDPLRSLPEPVAGACHADSGARIKQQTRTLTPGTYCGGLQISSGATVTLTPGIYVFKDGSLTIQSQAVVTGREVMLAFRGPDGTIAIMAGGKLDVTSPISGVYENIQFFGDRQTYLNIGNGANNPPGQDSGHLWFTVIGDSTLRYDGVLYMPAHHVWWAGGSTVEATSPNYAAIAKKLWFQDSTQVRLAKENRRGVEDKGAVALMRGAVLFR
jgi:hypothetical protein